MLELIQNEANKYGFGISKKELAGCIYGKIENCAILNEIYLSVEGRNYQFVKSTKNRKWIVREF